MIDPIILLAFLPAALALNLTPGADMLFCVAQGGRGGPRAAWAASAGISTGSMINSVLAGLGLGALITSHPLAFDAIRWVGVAYLLVLAVRTLRATPGQAVKSVPLARSFASGLLINLTNPKVILFILALFPQFADPARPLLPQFMAFGAILAFGGFFINGLVGAASGGLGGRLSQAPGVARGMRWLTATLFGALAVRLALETRG
jgi:threonine/homoserine/homoserine lactone efflux protein